MFLRVHTFISIIFIFALYAAIEVESAQDDYILSDKFFETDEDIVPVTTQGVAITTASPQKSTPLYWVIEDPRLKKRRLMEIRKKVQYIKGFIVLHSFPFFCFKRLPP